jgi:hypothetical protein
MNEEWVYDHVGELDHLSLCRSKSEPSTLAGLKEHPAAVNYGFDHVHKIEFTSGDFSATHASEDLEEQMHASCLRNAGTGVDTLGELYVVVHPHSWRL